MKYIDIDGIEIDAIEAQDPTILNTISGEKIAGPGDWIVTLSDGRIEVLANDVFQISFKIKE